jgi:hypothetical protein
VTQELEIQTGPLPELDETLPQTLRQFVVDRTAQYQFRN